MAFTVDGREMERLSETDSPAIASLYRECADYWTAIRSTKLQAVMSGATRTLYVLHTFGPNQIRLFSVGRLDWKTAWVLTSENHE
jgi:hypothetical protein